MLEEQVAWARRIGKVGGRANEGQADRVYRTSFIQESLARVEPGIGHKGWGSRLILMTAPNPVLPNSFPHLNPSGPIPTSLSFQLTRVVLLWSLTNMITLLKQTDSYPLCQ